MVRKRMNEITREEIEQWRQEARKTVHEALRERSLKKKATILFILSYIGVIFLSSFISYLLIGISFSIGVWIGLFYTFFYNKIEFFFLTILKKHDTRTKHEIPIPIVYDLGDKVKWYEKKGDDPK